MRKTNRITFIITIDPGLTGTGYAIWDKKWELMRYGILNPPPLSWENKAYAIAGKISELCGTYGVNEGAIEFPAFFQSAGGATVAASGALVKLTMLVGIICGTVDFKPILVEVRDWKGQLPKDVIIKRIKRILPNCKAKSHDWDAIGIGLHLKGDL